MSNSLEPDQASQFVGPDLGLNVLQRLSADDTSRRTVKEAMQFETDLSRTDRNAKIAVVILALFPSAMTFKIDSE